MINEVHSFRVFHGKKKPQTIVVTLGDYLPAKVVIGYRREMRRYSSATSQYKNSPLQGYTAFFGTLCLRKNVELVEKSPRRHARAGERTWSCAERALKYGKHCVEVGLHDLLFARHPQGPPGNTTWGVVLR